MLQQRDHRVVVIGGGQAGFEVCSKLRALGFTGSISLVAEEDVIPYQRPPLSKAYLLATMTADQLSFRPADYFAEYNISLQLGKQCTAINRADKVVTLSNDSILTYDSLVLATGSSPIRLPASAGGDLRQVHYVRTLKDADAMALDFKPGKKLLVIGGGYVGLEASAVASKIGMEVILVEAARRILERVASEETSSFFRKLHKSHGVTILESAMIKELVNNGSDGASGAILTDGRRLDADVFVVGIGVRPNVALAQEAGLAIDNGIAVDEFCTTTDPAIYAVGDCASFPHEKKRVRLESVGNAIAQAQVAAHVIAGDPRPYEAKPWFWSDQYNVKLQIAGLSTGYDHVIARGEAPGPLSHWYYKGEQLLAVDALNDPRAFMVAKRLIDAGKTADPHVVGDGQRDLKTLIIS